MDLLEKYVWMPDEEEAWIGCKISGVSEDGSITTLTPEYFSNPNPGNLKTFKKPSSEVMNYPAAQESTIRDDYSNLINLEEFTEGAVLHQLRSRYFKDKIYSEIGAILIAINPFKMMPIYNQKILNYYKTRSTDAEKEPHIFQTASRTYWDFMVDRKNQSMIISGNHFRVFSLIASHIITNFLILLIRGVWIW